MSPDELARSYDDALTKSQGVAMRLEPEVQTAAFARLAELFHDMTPDKVRSLVRSLYAQDAYLNDGLKVVVGADAIEKYLLRAVESADKVSFDFFDLATSLQGPEHYVRWEMTLERSGVNGGEPIRAAGVSHFRFDRSGRVLVQRDFWNTGSDFYERIRGLGWLIGRVRNRI